MHFFEEHPGPDTLAPAALITHPAMVFLASPTVAEFDRARELLGRMNPCLKPAWWPVLQGSLTFSVFSDPDELATFAAELQRAPPDVPLLLDLELPLWEARRLLRSPWRLRATGRRLDRLFAGAAANHEVWTPECPPVLDRVARFLRIALPGADTRTYMLYSTVLPNWWRRLLLWRLGRRLRTQAGAIGVGTLASGIAGGEPVLSPTQMARDLEDATSAGAGAVVVYRLGGLTRDHARVLSEARFGAGLD